MQVTQASAKAAFLAANLKAGEHYAGLLLGKNGEPDQHLVVIAVNDATANWTKQTKWAKSVGGDLPGRRELNLLRANMRELFKDDWYWSNETHASDSSYAWFQNFSYGGQYYDLKSAALRAVAVRRFPL
ncbi:MAG: DUF1566 domain-containing protein [Betaproteobacteria bacterium]|nr:DUF1566 domain-containing protein [Betaproteobacteria bacterium]